VYKKTLAFAMWHHVRKSHVFAND